MAWETLRSNDGIYLIDWAGLTRIIRSCKRAGAMKDYSTIETKRASGIGVPLACDCQTCTPWKWIGSA